MFPNIFYTYLIMYKRRINRNFKSESDRRIKV